MAEWMPYHEQFESLRIEVDELGVALATLHTDGGAVIWDLTTHRATARAFASLAQARDIRAIVLTGTGEWFTGPAETPRFAMQPRDWDEVLTYGRRLVRSYIDIEVPVVAAVNGSATRHAELGLLGDIVLATADASFDDRSHFVNGLVPGDGIASTLTALLGPSKARFLLWTGARLTAADALAAGLVHEICPGDSLVGRAVEYARDIVAQDDLVVRYTKQLLSAPIRRAVLADLDRGFAFEGLASAQAYTDGLILGSGGQPPD